MTTTATDSVLPVGVTLPEAEPAPLYEFDADFQQKIAALIIRDTPFAQLTDGLIRPEYFENSAFATLVMTQDGAACEMNQRGLTSPKFTRARLMPQEFDIVNFHNWFEAQMTAKAP